jgi:hypothetical protein
MLNLEANLTADPQNSPHPILPAIGFFFGGCGADMADFGFVPTSMTLVNIGERSMGQIWGFWGVEIRGFGAGAGAWRGEACFGA